MSARRPAPARRPPQRHRFRPGAGARAAARGRAPTSIYRIFNADGSEVEQCGNGARCIARFVARAPARSERPAPASWTAPAASSMRVLRDDGLVVGRNGRPGFRSGLAAVRRADRGAHAIDSRRRAGPVEFGAVSIGNPHAVIRVRSVDDAPVDTRGTRHGESRRVSAACRTSASSRSSRPTTCGCASSNAASARRWPAARAPVRRWRSGRQHGPLAERGEGGRAGRAHDRALARAGRAGLAHGAGRNGF